MLNFRESGAKNGAAIMSCPRSGCQQPECECALYEDGGLGVWVGLKNRAGCAAHSEHGNKPCKKQKAEYLLTVLPVRIEIQKAKYLT